MSLEKKQPCGYKPTNCADNYCAKIRKKIQRKFYTMLSHETMINMLIVQDLFKAGDRD
jgi:hypothetical protein